MTVTQSLPMIDVPDVEASSTWYCRLLGCRSIHGGPHFDQLVDGDLTVLLLHKGVAPERGDSAVPAAGLSLYLKVTDLEACHERARELGARVVREPAFSELSHQHECELRDPDGYLLVLCA